jgi:glycosyltransferase involved in cell wall biosynthesis
VFALQVADTKAAGGIETAVEHYSAMFREVGVASACLYRGPAAERLRAAGVEVLSAPDRLMSPLAALVPASDARRATLSASGGVEPALVVVHSDRSLAGIRRLFPRAKTVAPCHSDKAKHKRVADLIVTLNAEQDALVRRIATGSRAKVAMLGNPYVPAPRTKAPRRNGPPRVVFCARFTETKDPLTLVRATPLVRTRPAPEVVFIGGGPLEADLRAAAGALGPEAPVAFPGWLSDPWPEIGPDDLLVLPSRWEGLPFLLQEALDRKVLVVAADNAGNRRALGDGAFGLLFPPGDEQALAACIDEALAAPDRLRAMAAAGRENLVRLYGARGFWSELSRALNLAPE